MALIGLRKDGTQSGCRLPGLLLSQSSEKSPQKFTRSAARPFYGVHLKGCI